MNPTDALSSYYAELLEGSYDCVDRVVLNAYFPMGQTGGGLRTWWRQLHGSDANLNNDQLRDMAGTFSRRLRAYCARHEVPVIDVEAGRRKRHEWVERQALRQKVTVAKSGNCFVEGSDFAQVNRLAALLQRESAIGQLAAVCE